MPISQITEITKVFEESVKASQGVTEIQEAIDSNSKGGKSPKK
jgi:hypothetical protein